MKDLIVLKKEGMYCPLGKFFLDPILPVDKAVKDRFDEYVQSRL